MFDKFSLSSYEKRIASARFSPVFSSVLSGTSRSLRLSYVTRSREDEVIYRISAGLVAPVSLLFVWWCFQTAIKNRVKRLYFLSRDGEIFFKTATALAKSWNLDFDLRYLYCSRESLLVPSLNSVEAFEENWLTWAYQGEISLEEVCRRVRLEPTDFQHLGAQFSLEKYFDQPSKIFSPNDRGRLLEFVRCASFAEIAREKNIKQFEDTICYLEQEGMADGVRLALVDTGWTGSSQYALGGLLNKAGIPIPSGLKGYYLGVNSVTWAHPGDILEGFLFDWRKTRTDSRLYNFICYELLFSGLHGRTVGYEENGGKFYPVFKGGLEGFSRRASDIHHGIAAEYASRIAKILPFESFNAEVASKNCRNLIRDFICNPSCEVATTYGDWPMGSEIRERDYQRVAPPMDLKAFLRCASGREKVRGYWPQASLIRGKQRGLAKAYNLFLATGLLDWYRRFLLRY